MSQHVVPIEQINQTLVSQAGSKSVQLGSLTSAGFRVPRGFCILSSGYESFVKENRLQEKIRQFVQEISSRSGPTRQGGESKVLEVFQSAEFPDFLKDEILRAYRKLSRKRAEFASVAVRSSGSLEDGSKASFAGQFESFLNIRGEQELLDQIKRCWAGFWKARSLYYQRDRGMTDSASGIAVLVQKMVPARLAGVLFSANPLSGSTRQMVIEASWGLGEAIVEGTVKPDRFVVDTEKKEIIEQTIQDKKIMIVLNADQGGTTRKVRVPRNKQSIPCLTEKQVERLVSTGKKVQEYFGSPQDIEWAYGNRYLYLLQARPITTLPCPEKGSPRTATGRWLDCRSEFDTETDPDTQWISSTIRDMLPGALSPLTISQMKALEYGFQKPQRELGLLPAQFEAGEETQFLGFFYSRAHLNMSLIRSLTRKVPLVSSANLEKVLEEESTGSKEGPWAYLRFVRDIPNMLQVGFHALEIVRKLEPAAQSLLACGVREYATHWQEKETRIPDNRELLRRLDAIQEKRAEIYATHITASQFGDVTFQLLRRLVRRLTKDEYGNLATQLISGSSTPLFAKPIAELWGLGQQVSLGKKLQQHFSAHSMQTTWRQLKSDGSRSVKNFLDAFQVFLTQYGYRSRYGAELMRPSWDEEPIFILSLVKIYSRLLLTLNPWEMEREQAQRRLSILRGMESHLNPLSKRVLNELLELMHTLIPLRQNMRALSLMQARLSRGVVQQVEQKLLAAGILSQEKDVYFLTMGELYGLLQETPDRGAGTSALVPEVRQRVERRKMEFHRNLNVVLPGSFRGRPKPILDRRLRDHRKAGRRLSGIPTSPGRVTGQARRITGPVQEIRVRPGEILILPGMDPGWTPLFLSAAAIITERGGILSHGSILAREYGIPAITNIADATHIIETGQVITVDGERGEIWL